MKIHVYKKVRNKTSIAVVDTGISFANKKAAFSWMKENNGAGVYMLVPAAEKEWVDSRCSFAI